MHLIHPAAPRLSALALSAVAGIMFLAVSGRAADPVVPAETRGAFEAASFSPLPEESRIEIRLMDDSPENLELGAVIRDELQRRGYVSPEGERLVLTIETEVSVITGDREGITAADDDDSGVDVLGFLRALLDDPRTEERLWAAEAVYRRSDGDLPAGARSLVPLLVDSIGRSPRLEDVTIR